jgi:tetratricopeptide (TPR) repeat protein
MREILKLPILISLIILVVNCGGEKISGNSLFFEVHTTEGIKQVVVEPNHIRAGIDERGGEPIIGITVDQKYHEAIENLTKENIGQKMVIRIGTDTVFSGTIMEAIQKGKLALNCGSVQEAEIIFKKMGRTPDYRLKLSQDELKTSKKTIEPFKSQWANKALEASGKGDYGKAEEYSKKAVDEEPHEAQYHKLLSLAYYQRGNKKLALDEALTAEKLTSKKDFGESRGIYFDIAFLYTQLNEYEKAVGYLKKILSYNENDFLARLRLGETYEKMGKYDLATQEYLYLSSVEDDNTVREKGIEGLRRLDKKGR